MLGTVGGERLHRFMGSLSVVCVEAVIQLMQYNCYVRGSPQIN